MNLIFDLNWDDKIGIGDGLERRVNEGFVKIKHQTVPSTFTLDLPLEQVAVSSQPAASSGPTCRTRPVSETAADKLGEARGLFLFGMGSRAILANRSDDRHGLQQMIQRIKYSRITSVSNAFFCPFAPPINKRKKNPVAG